MHTCPPHPAAVPSGRLAHLAAALRAMSDASHRSAYRHEHDHLALAYHEGRATAFAAAGTLVQHASQWQEGEQ